MNKLDDQAVQALERLLEAVHYLTHPERAGYRWKPEPRLVDDVKVAYREFERAEEEVAA